MYQKRPGSESGRGADSSAEGVRGMDLSGEYRIPAPRERVWVLLNDVETLRACIPGCESLERTGDEMTARVRTKIGPVAATFNGMVRLVNVVPPQGYRIEGEGKGGVAGFASGGADVVLDEPEPGVTVLRYTADARVGGKLAQLGSRLIDATARKLADQFFACFAEKAAGAGAEAMPAAAADGTGPGETPMPGLAAAGIGALAASPAPAEPRRVLRGSSDSIDPEGGAPVARDLDGDVGDIDSDADLERAADEGGILAHDGPDMPVGAAAQTTTGLDIERFDDPEPIPAPAPDAPAATRAPLPPEPVSGAGLAAASATPHESIAERAEERLEVEAGRGTLGGPWAWGLIALAALIVLLAILT